MTDAYPTQIINPSRNCNTFLQTSTLQSTSTTLNKSYSFQSLRTVKGNIIANGDGNFTVLNMYDGSPLKLNVGDIILRIVISNATYAQPVSQSTPYFDTTYNNYTQPWNYDGNSSYVPQMTFLLTKIPTYNPGVSTPALSQVNTELNNPLVSYSWTPNITGTPLPLNSPFNHTSTGPLYSATYPPNCCSIPVTYQNAVQLGGGYQWIVCNILNLSMSSGIAGINVSFLVLNPTVVE